MSEQNEKARTRRARLRARLPLALAVAAPAFLSALWIVDWIPNGAALYWLMAPLYFSGWLAIAIGRSVWLEVAGWAGLAISSLYLFEAAYAKVALAAAGVVSLLA